MQSDMNYWRSPLLNQERVARILLTPAEHFLKTTQSHGPSVVTTRACQISFQAPHLPSSEIAITFFSNVWETISKSRTVFIVADATNSPEFFPKKSPVSSLQLL